jgi:branched-subunit amino acid permease
MYDPQKIVARIEKEVKPMRRSRQKTLSVLVAGAMGAAVMALTYFFLCALGAAAKKTGQDAQWKPNTSASRMTNLVRMGYHFYHAAALALPLAIQAINELPP